MKKLQSKYTLSHGNTVSQININEFYFVIIVTPENGVPIEMMRQMLGYKYICITPAYTRSTQQKVSNNMQALRERLAIPRVGFPQIV